MTKPHTITCLRCGYTWVPLVEHPVSCPKCHSYHHDKPRQRPPRKPPEPKEGD